MLEIILYILKIIVEILKASPFLNIYFAPKHEKNGAKRTTYIAINQLMFCVVAYFLVLQPSINKMTSKTQFQTVKMQYAENIIIDNMYSMLKKIDYKVYLSWIVVKRLKNDKNFEYTYIFKDVYFKDNDIVRSFMHDKEDIRKTIYEIPDFINKNESNTCKFLKQLKHLEVQTIREKECRELGLYSFTKFYDNFKDNTINTTKIFLFKQNDDIIYGVTACYTYNHDLEFILDENFAIIAETFRKQLNFTN